MKLCQSCPRLCKSVRTDENIGGFCGMPALPRIAKASLHFWEEPCISGESGSGTIFFSGCTMRCVYCQNYEISHKKFGKTVSVERLAEIYRELENKGAQNINLVNPTHYFEAIKSAAKIYKPNIPFVYNSGGYELEDVSDNNLISIYLFDIKYADNEKAKKYSSAPGYFEISTSAIKKAYDKIGECRFDERGMLISGIIIRHLLLPSSTNDAIKIINWAKENCPGAVFSLMAQYVPCGEAEKYPEINRRVTKREYEKVSDYLLNADFKYAYLQERESASGTYIPDFDLEGV